MGKKKSVVLMILLTIVIVALCAITVFPAFAVPGTVKKWNPAVLQYDLDLDLGGGYYAYYYPEGIVSETEYDNNLAALEEKGEEGREEYEDYQNSYVAYKGLYVSMDEDFGVYSGNPDAPVAENFKTQFSQIAAQISARYKAKGYSSYRVAVVDDYAIRVELPASEDNVSLPLTYFSYTGEMTLQKGGEIVDELKDEGAQISDLIKSVSVATRYKTSYLKIKFTDKGQQLISNIKGELSSSTDATSADGTAVTTLDIMIGSEVLVQIYSDNLLDNNKEARVLPIAQEDKDNVKTVEILFESAMEHGGFDFNLQLSEVRTFEPVYGENTLTLLYIVIAIVLLALLILPIIKMNRYGVVSMYATLSYLIVTGICFAFITGGVFEISLGSALVFLAGLVLVNVIQAYVYQAIKAEFALGKTVESSVKGGHRKTLFGIVDIYALLLLGALALLVGAAGLHTVALQAIICILTGAFINLLWARAINFIFLSASKNKYKYFRFVREEDDDE